MNAYQLYTVLRNLATSHLQINDFYFGSLQQALHKENVITYPCLIVSIENVRYQKLLSTFTLKLFFLDKLTVDDENLDDIIADTEAMANDYYLMLSNTTWVKDYLMIDNVSSVKVADLLPDKVAGWVLTLDCKSYSALCLNDLPITGTVPNYEKCKVQGEEGNVVIIGQNNYISDGQVKLNLLALKAEIPTHLSQLQQSPIFRTVTDAEKAVWNKVGKYKGVHPSLQALIDAVSDPEAGDWGHVDEGQGHAIKLYIYDANDNEWQLSQGSSAVETDPIFVAWLATNPLQYFITHENDPVFTAWLATNPLQNFITEEQDPQFNAWLNTNPLANYLTEVARDGTLKGNGKTTNPLGVAEYLLRNDITATFDGCYTSIPINTIVSKPMVRKAEIEAWRVYGFNHLGGNATITVDVEKNGVSMVGGGGTRPNLTNQMSNSGGVVGWSSTTLADGDLITFKVIANTNCVYFVIVLRIKTIE